MGSPIGEPTCVFGGLQSPSRGLHITLPTLVVVAILAVLPLTGCRKRSPTPAPALDPSFLEGTLPPSVLEGTPRRGGELRVRIWAEPSTLNPMLSPDGLAWRLVEDRVFEKLIQFDRFAPDGTVRYVPGLATRWEISPDGLSYTFHLRAGVRWHDGKPFTAADVVNTLDVILGPKGAPHLKPFFEVLARYAAPDPATFVAVYKKPYALALENFASQLMVLPAHLVSAADPLASTTGRAPIGTGPWKFERWDAGQRIAFERNSDYWGQKTNLDRVSYRIVADDAKTALMLDRGDLDVAMRITPEQYLGMAEDAKMAKRFRRARHFGRIWSFVAWNTRRAPLDDANVRRAFGMIADLDRYREKVLRGLERPVRCVYYWHGQECPEDLPALPPDPAQARALLAQSGWRDSDGDGFLDNGGKRLEVHLLHQAGVPYFSVLAAYLEEAFRKAGVALALEPVDWSLFLKRLREHSFDAAALSLSGSSPLSDPYEIFHSTQKDGANYSGIADSELDGLLERARTELDETKHLALTRAVSKRIWALQPLLFVNLRPQLYAISRQCKGVRTGLADLHFEDWWLEP